MKKDKVFLLLNGDKPKQLPTLDKYKLICATDGAYKYLEQNNVSPHFVTGDFDSLTNFSRDIEFIETPDQDFTDFDKILQILFDKGFYHIDVYGASGAEQDHFLGNLHTAIQWQHKLKLTFFDNYSTYYLADKLTSIKNCKEKIVSLIPFPEAKLITTRGLEYPLEKENLTFGERIGTRNKAVKNEVSISFTEGNLFIFMNN